MHKLFSPVLMAFMLGAGALIGRLSAPPSVSESQWVTVIRDGRPVWVEISASAAPTPVGFPNALTATPTRIVPEMATPTQVTPAAPTITPLPAGGVPSIECDAYPCTAYADDLFVSGVPFKFKANAALNIRICPSILCDLAGPKTTAGIVYNVWAIYIKSPGANSERWACVEDTKDCHNWFAISGDFTAPFGVLEIYSTDVTPY